MPDHIQVRNFFGQYFLVDSDQKILDLAVTQEIIERLTETVQQIKLIGENAAMTACLQATLKVNADWILMPTPEEIARASECVYFIQYPDESGPTPGFVKIGRSTNLLKRLADHRREISDAPIVMEVAQTPHSILLEQELHHAFAAYRRELFEWFEVAPVCIYLDLVRNATGKSWST